MGMFRKSGGGGFLNGASGALEAIKFDIKQFGEGDGAYHKLSAELVIREDGKDSVQQFADAGFAYPDDGHAVSEDGTTLEGGLQVSEDSNFARFVQTAIEGGVPESEIPEDGSNFDALTNYRYTYAKEQDKARQMGAGKKKLGSKAKTASDEEIMKAGRRQDKNDKTKFYNHDRLIVSAVLGTADAKPATKGTKAAPKATASKASKASDVDYSATDEILISLLADAKDDTVKKSSLSSLVVRKALEDDMDNETRDAHRALFASDEYLGREAGWTFDSGDKNKPVKLAKGKK